MEDFDHQFAEWLRSAAASLPSGYVAGICFNLYELPPGTDAAFSLEMIGSREFDAHDPDWACDECWAPPVRSIRIPCTWSGSGWKNCLDRIKDKVRLSINSTEEVGQILRETDGVGVGFVGGDLHLVWIKATG